MARGPLHRGALRPKDEQLAARAEAVARITVLLGAEPLTAAEVHAKMGGIRATVFGYMRYMHRVLRVARPSEEMRGRAALWVLGADLTLPTEDELIDRAFAPRRPMVPAQQLGLQRHWMDVALFGPARATGTF